MKNIFIKTNIKLLLIMSFSILSFNVTHANIFDDFLNSFKSKNEATLNQSDNNKINKEIEDYLDNRQKEVVGKVDDIYNSILNIDFNSFRELVDYPFPQQVENNINDFFDEYDNSKNNAKSILKLTNYKINNVSNNGEKIIVNLTYSYPSIKNIVSKILPEVLIKNPKIIFGGTITNDTINSILDSAKSELNKNRYEMESFTREFTFKKISGKWKLTDVGKIVNDITQYINDIERNIFN